MDAGGTTPFRASRWKGILLDLDNTLLDEEGASEAAFRALIAEHDTRPASVSFEARLASWRAATRAHWARFEAGELTFQEQRRWRVRDYLGAAISDEAADRAFRSYEVVYERAWSWLPGVETFLEATRDIPKVIVTNGDAAMQRRKVTATGLDVHCVGVVTPEDSGCWKPEPGAFEAGLAILGLSPRDCLMIGDDPRRDIEPARALGMAVLHVDPLATRLDALFTRG